MKKLLLLLGLVLLVATPLALEAQIAPLDKDDCSKLGIGCNKKDSADTVTEVAFRVINVFLTIIGVVALAALIWGGVLYIISLGNDQQVTQAKKIILYAIIGLVVIGLSALIVNLVINAF